MADDCRLIKKPLVDLRLPNTGSYSLDELTLARDLLLDKVLSEIPNTCPVNYHQTFLKNRMARIRDAFKFATNGKAWTKYRNRHNVEEHLRHGIDPHMVRFLFFPEIFSVRFRFSTQYS